MVSVVEKDNRIELKSLTNFDITKIFDCGQCFRFDEKDGKIIGVAYNKVITLEQTAPDSVTITGINLQEFNDVFCTYFGLDTDYSAIDEDIIKRLDNDETIVKAIEYGKGIRLLRQDGWEALCSFIISQNNNIPRIKKIIADMSRAYGENIVGDYYAFPTPESLVSAGVDKIFELKTGFRAKYIYDAAEKVASGKVDLSLIDGMTTAEATEYLMQIKGVGLKVASCALLFGFNKTDAFPVDV
ncbi:MAG: DNA-3-methyladenine glycosylase 2 family protein, partial [Ruminiclostridium sp.]|nr:DNA-3-methyladenine glycosylase 2 family protein [Ruminiclostridium sp.]